MRTSARKLLLSAALLTAAAAAQTPDPTTPPPNQQPVLTVQGKGSQIYTCQPVNNAFQWIFQAPVARLFDPTGTEVGTHGDGPIWTYQDGSSIHGILAAKAPSPTAGSIPWLLLKAANPQRTGVLTNVQYIRRSDTQGGAAPATGCDATHKGDLLRIPYTATYTFYTAAPAKP